jgi:DHA2 family multidrug resistance protein
VGADGAGVGTFALRCRPSVCLHPVLLTGMAVMGMGCTLTPVLGSALWGLAPHQVAGGSTLIHVNLQVAGAIGTPSTLSGPAGCCTA